jgi:hypothetical protein
VFVIPPRLTRRLADRSQRFNTKPKRLRCARMKLKSTARIAPGVRNVFRANAKHIPATIFQLWLLSTNQVVKDRSDIDPNLRFGQYQTNTDNRAARRIVRLRVA